jgi:hypothetical protein
MDALTLILLYGLLRFIVPFVLLLMLGTWVQRGLGGNLRQA